MSLASLLAKLVYFKTLSFDQLCKKLVGFFPKWSLDSSGYLSYVVGAQLLKLEPKPTPALKSALHLARLGLSRLVANPAQHYTNLSQGLLLITMAGLLLRRRIAKVAKMLKERIEKIATSNFYSSYEGW